MTPPQQLQQQPAPNDLTILAPLIREGLHQYGRRTDVEAAQLKTENESRKRDQQQTAKDHLYVFLLSVVLVLIAAGLIFLKDNARDGLLLLSHLVTLAIGIFGGMALTKSRE